MKIKVLVIVIALVAIIGVGKGLEALRANQAGKPADTAQAPSQQASGQQAGNQRDPAASLKPVVDDQGGIQVGVVWEKQEASAKQKFQIELNNHMLSLDDFDFSHNIRLEIEGVSKNVVVEVLSRDGSGHHVTAEISVENPELANLKPGSKIALIVEKVGDTPVRKFNLVY